MARAVSVVRSLRPARLWSARRIIVRPKTLTRAGKRGTRSRNGHHRPLTRCSVWKQRDGQAVITPEQDRTEDRVRAEALSDLVQCLVERDPVVALEREHELEDTVVVQVRDRDPDE